MTLLLKLSGYPGAHPFTGALMDDCTQSNCFDMEDIQAQRMPRTAVGVRPVQ